MTGASSRPPRGGWDPLDAPVFHDTATAPGLVLKCNIIGVLEVLQKEKRKKSIRNDRRITPLCAPEPFTKDCIVSNGGRGTLPGDWTWVCLIKFSGELRRDLGAVRRQLH
jgi:hypothetical protein